MDDILRRLGNVETDVSELRSEVRAISATIPHLATAVSVSEILAIIPYLATKADLKAEIGEARTEMRAEIGSVRSEIADVKTAVAKVETKLASMEAAIIKWIIGTTLTTAGLVFTIAKFVH